MFAAGADQHRRASLYRWTANSGVAWDPRSYITAELIARWTTGSLTGKKVPKLLVQSNRVARELCTTSFTIKLSLLCWAFAGRGPQASLAYTRPRRAPRIGQGDSGLSGKFCADWRFTFAHVQIGSCTGHNCAATDEGCEGCERRRVFKEAE